MKRSILFNLLLVIIIIVIVAYSASALGEMRLSRQVVLLEQQLQSLEERHAALLELTLEHGERLNDYYIKINKLEREVFEQ